MDFEFETLNLENTELQKIKKIANWYLDEKSSIHLFVKFHDTAAREYFLKRKYLSDAQGNLSFRGKTRLKILTKNAVQFDVEAFNLFFKTRMKKGRVSPNKASLVVSLLKGHILLRKVQDASILKNFYFLLYNGFIEKNQTYKIYYPTKKAESIFALHKHLNHISTFEDKKPESGELLYGLKVRYDWVIEERIYKISEVKIKKRFIVDQDSPPYSLSIIDLEGGKKVLLNPSGSEITKSRYFLPKYQTITWLGDPTPLLSDKKYFAIPQGILADGEGLIKIQEYLNENLPELSL